MKLKYIITVLLLSSMGWAAQAAPAGKIVGYQYVTFPDGDAPLEDNVIHTLPCYPQERVCEEVATAISAEVNQAQADLQRARLLIEKPIEAWQVFSQLDQQLLPMLTSKKGYKTIKTGKKGVFSFFCPTKECLLYSFGVARERYGYWILIVPNRKRMDLGPGKGVTENKPRNL